MTISPSSRDLVAFASLMDLSKRSTSAIEDFMFCPDTANCSVNAAIRASDSLSFDRAESNPLCLDATSVFADAISNFKRSQS